MLPLRAYSDLADLPVRATARAIEKGPMLVAAVTVADVTHLVAAGYVPIPASSTAEAVRAIERDRPTLVVVAGDDDTFDGLQVCAAAQRLPGTRILVLIERPERAPAALKAGCHSVLLKPVLPNLVAARLARLSRELLPAVASRRIAERLSMLGTNRRWPEMACPKCATLGAIGFEHASHRRDWYACLACEAVWLGRRQE
jgi:CheY-like chemotaxis protein